MTRLLLTKWTSHVISLALLDLCLGDTLSGVQSRGIIVNVAVKLLLSICLLAAHTPVCKVAAAQSLAPSRIQPPQTPNSPTPKCKKGCCPAECPNSPLTPKPERGSPAKPECPKNCLSPLCAVPPAIVSSPDLVVADLPLTGELIATPQTSAADVFHCRLDRPPRI